MNHRYLLLTTVVIIACVGCSAKPTKPPYESTQALATLRTTLDAWRDGHLDALAERQPPIRFEDDDQRSGQTLVAYNLLPSDQPAQAFEDISVNMTLRDGDGATHEKTVVYQVTLEPSLAVLRND